MDHGDLPRTGDRPVVAEMMKCHVVLLKKGLARMKQSLVRDLVSDLAILHSYSKGVPTGVLTKVA